MKNLKINLLLIMLFAFAFGISSCGGNSSESHEKTEQHDGSMAEDNYSCPMHPEIKGKKGDKCSKCNMDLKMADKDDHSGHNH